MRITKFGKLTVLALGLAGLGLLLLSPPKTIAANPTTMNFQGKIVNFTGGTNITNPNNAYSIVFRVYNTSSPTMTTACNTTASCLWEETQASVQLTNGIFQVELGSACALTSASCNNAAGGPINFASSNSLYLTMQFNGDTSGSNGGFMSPLIHITSVPFALQADNSATLGGLASSAFAQLAQAAAFTSSVSIQPATNIVGLTVKQNSNGSPTADILDIQTQNGTGVITVTGPALNEAGVTITSVGATRDLTLGSASGIIKLSSATTSLQKSASSFTLDIANAGASTLNVSNSNGSNIASLSVSGDIAVATGRVYKVGATSGSSISACGAGNYVGSFASTGGLVTGGSCTALSTYDNVSVNGSAATDANFLDVASSSAVTGTTWGLDTAANPDNITISIANAALTTAGAVTAGTQTFGGAKTFKTDSATAFTVQSVTGSNILLSIDTNSSIVNLGITDALSSVSGTVNIGNGGGTETVVIGSGSFGSSTQISSGSGDINLSTSAAGHGTTIQNFGNSTTALQVLSGAGTQVLAVDTAGSNQNNLVFNPSVESAASIGTAGDWQKRGGSETAFAQDSTQFYSGLDSLKVTTTAVAGDGAKQSGVNSGSNLTNGTTYTISFYAKLDSASATFASGQGLRAGYAYNGSDITTLVSQTFTPLSTGWMRFSWTFLQNQTNSGTPYVFIKQTDANIHTLYLDAITVQTDANTDTNYREGKILTSAIIASPVTLQNATNSSTAFQIQNAGGSSVFSLDTTTTNIVTNPGLETNTTSWAVLGSSTILRDTSQAQTGSAALKITTTTAANDGAKFTTGTTWLTQNTQYTMVAYAKASGTNFSTFEMGHRLTTAAGEQSCLTAQTVVTGGWTRYSCTFTTANTTPDNSYIYFKNTASADARTFWIDGLRLDPGAALNSYGAGAISLNATIKSALFLQNSSDSTTEFLAQNAAGTMLFTIDSTNSQIEIGSPTTDANAVALILDSYNNGTDPAGAAVNGAMYYNTNTSKFRCYQNSAWTNCIATGIASFTVLTSTTANSTYSVPSGVTSIMVEMLGGGGAGGSSAGSANNAGAGAGGGAGGYARKIITGPAASYTYTIGTGGAVGAAGNNAGGNGGQSCFGTNATACTTPIFSCNGGTGGGGSGAAGTTNVSSTGGAGGTCTSGDLSITGSAGGNGTRWSGTALLSGYGAGTMFGSGASSSGVTGAGVASGASTYGSAGGGAVSVGNVNNQGGVGRQGVIIIWEFK